MSIEELAEKIIGAWTGVSCTYTNAAGEVIDFYGPNFHGFLCYDDLGNISAQLGNKDTPEFTSDPTGFTGTSQECKTAFDNYHAYYGTYRIDHEKQVIIHTVTAALKTNWIGREEIRYAKLDNDILTITTAPIGLEDKDQEVFTIRWKRVSR
jgi:hypothetical protein